MSKTNFHEFSPLVQQLVVKTLGEKKKTERLRVKNWYHRYGRSMWSGERGYKTQEGCNGNHKVRNYLALQLSPKACSMNHRSVTFMSNPTYTVIQKEAYCNVRTKWLLWLFSILMSICGHIIKKSKILHKKWWLIIFNLLLS